MKIINQIKSLPKKVMLAALILVIIIAAVVVFLLIKNKDDTDIPSIDAGFKTIAQQQEEQKSIKDIKPTPEVVEANLGKMAAVNFYGDYALNTKDAASLSAYLQKHGTANLVKQYNSEVKAGYNPLLCGARGTPTSASITGEASVDAKKIYALRVMNRTKPLNDLQVVVVKQNGNYLVDNIACAGPV